MNEAQIIRERDKILRAAGFVDIEDKHGRITESTAHKELCRMGPEQAALLIEVGRERDSAAREILRTNIKRHRGGARYGKDTAFAFSEKFQREAFALHVEGMPMSAIAKHLKTSKSRVHAAIKPLADDAKRLTRVTSGKLKCYIKELAEDQWLSKNNVKPIKRHRQGRLPKTAWEVTPASIPRTS